MNNNDFDFLFLVETWLTNVYSDNFILNLSDYNNIVRRDRHDKVGGGVAIIIHSSLKFTEVELSPQFDAVEVLCIDVNLHSDLYRFIIAYRPPNQSLEVFSIFVDCISSLSDSFVGKIFLIGDFNLLNIDWCSGKAIVGDSFSVNFLELVTSLYLKQVIFQPTRGCNVLDLVCCTDDHVISNVHFGERFCNSDHNVITFDITAPSIPVCLPKSNYKLVFNWKAGEYQQISDALVDINWSDKFDGCYNVNNYWSTFRDTLFDQFNYFISKHCSATFVRKKSTFFSSNLHKLYSKRKRYW